jgi:hypothetical protein
MHKYQQKHIFDFSNIFSMNYFIFIQWSIFYTLWNNNDNIDFPNWFNVLSKSKTIDVF